MTHQKLTPLGDPVRLEIQPVAKPRMTQRDKWAKRPIVMAYYAFADALRAQVRGELEPRLKVTFFVPMPMSWSQKKRTLMVGTPHQARPDVDNFLKAFMDALCSDDSYIYDVHALKFWAETGAIEIEEFGND